MHNDVKFHWVHLKKLIFGRTAHRLSTLVAIPIAIMSTPRDSAFNILADKKASDASRAKTRMCENTMAGKKCYRKFCGFAHSKAELRLPTCHFGAECRNIFSTEKKCLFVHPCDDEHSYVGRTGKSWPLDVSIPLPAGHRPSSAAEVQQQQKAAIDVMRSMMEDFPSLPRHKEASVEQITSQMKSVKISWADICDAPEVVKSVRQFADTAGAVPVTADDDNSGNDSDSDDDEPVKIVLKKPKTPAVLSVPAGSGPFVEPFPAVPAPSIPAPFVAVVPVAPAVASAPAPITVAATPVSAPTSAPVSAPATPAPRITISLSPEQFALVYPHLSQLGMAFGFPGQM